MINTNRRKYCGRSLILIYLMIEVTLEHCDVITLMSLTPSKYESKFNVDHHYYGQSPIYSLYSKLQRKQKVTACLILIFKFPFTVILSFLKVFFYCKCLKIELCSKRSMYAEFKIMGISFVLTTGLDVLPENMKKEKGLLINI